MMFCPQLSTLGPQRFWHQVETGTGMQHVPFASHIAPPGQEPQSVGLLQGSV
jgi:hypothetical protein